VDHFVDMPGRVRVLDRSWRVPRAVQRLSDGIISRVRHRRPKEWTPRDEEGEVRQISLEEVDWSAPEILVLARNGLHLEAVKKRIHRSGYMYEMRGRPSIKDSVRAKLLTWERLRRGEPQRVEDVVRVYEEMSSGVGVARGHKELRSLARDQMVTLADLQAHGGLLRTDVWHDALDRIPVVDREYIRACLRRGERMSASPRIRLSTIHGAKGGEAQEVVLITDMAARTWREAERTPDDEARVWYVAATRAKERLSVVRPMTDRHFTLRTW
jgi:superfamily I DNA/RNA helicase